MEILSREPTLADLRCLPFVKVQTTRNGRNRDDDVSWNRAQRMTAPLYYPKYDQLFDMRATFLSIYRPINQSIIQSINPRTRD